MLINIILYYKIRKKNRKIVRIWTIYKRAHSSIFRKPRSKEQLRAVTTRPPSSLIEKDSVFEVKIVVLEITMPRKILKGIRKKYHRESARSRKSIDVVSIKYNESFYKFKNRPPRLFYVKVFAGEIRENTLCFPFPFRSTDFIFSNLYIFSVSHCIIS